MQVIMDSWTYQLGYPLVTLRRHGNLIHASQKHFLLVNSSVHRNTSQKWYIPLSFMTSASPKSENQIWMHGKDGNPSLTIFNLFYFRSLLLFSAFYLRSKINLEKKMTGFIAN